MTSGTTPVVNGYARDRNVCWRHLRYVDLAAAARDACEGTQSPLLPDLLDEFDECLDEENLVPSTDLYMTMVLAGSARRRGRPASESS